MTVAYINTEIKKRIHAQILLEMTTDDPSASSIDEDRLNAAISDAIGFFEFKTGIAEDTHNGNLSHLSAICVGVMAYLEKWKSRDSNMVAIRKTEFEMMCYHISQKLHLGAYTTSNLIINNTKQYSDFDRPKLFGSKTNYGGDIRRKSRTYNGKDTF